MTSPERVRRVPLAGRARHPGAAAAAVATVVLLGGCGDSDPQATADPDPGATTTATADAQPDAAPAADDPADDGDSFTRDSFSCDLLEPHRAELAGLVGFDPDPARGLESATAEECAIRGEDGAFARVALAPAIIGSVDVLAQGYDATPVPADGLGEGAVFLGGSTQSNVLFAIGPHVLEVDAELAAGQPAPTQAALVAFAQRVRELLTSSP